MAVVPAAASTAFTYVPEGTASTRGAPVIAVSSAAAGTDSGTGTGAGTDAGTGIGAGIGVDGGTDAGSDADADADAEPAAVPEAAAGFCSLKEQRTFLHRGNSCRQATSDGNFIG